MVVDEGNSDSATRQKYALRLWMCLVRQSAFPWTLTMQAAAARASSCQQDSSNDMHLNFNIYLGVLLQGGLKFTKELY